MRANEIEPEELDADTKKNRRISRRGSLLVRGFCKRMGRTQYKRSSLLENIIGPTNRTNCEIWVSQSQESCRKMVTPAESNSLGLLILQI